MKWKSFVDAAEAGDEMVLKGTDSTFGCIAAVHTRWNKLEVDFLYA
jgi:hypothetical protein